MMKRTGCPVQLLIILRMFSRSTHSWWERKQQQQGCGLIGCQLGLFGYGRKGKSEYKITGRKIENLDEIIDAIKNQAVDGKIACALLWKIADDADIIRCEAGNAADALGYENIPLPAGSISNNRDILNEFLQVHKLKSNLLFFGNCD